MSILNDIFKGLGVVLKGFAFLLKYAFIGVVWYLRNAKDGLQYYISKPKKYMRKSKDDELV